MSEPIPPSPPPPADAPAAAAQPSPAKVQAAGRGGAALIFVGIFASRIIGFVREYTFAHYFGIGSHADVFRAAIRVPNVIQNLLGEGTLSAAFIPLYARMIHEGREYLDTAWWISVFPGVILMLTSLVVSRTGDWLRDVLDPTLRGE